jgi:hypothetical protein
MSFKTKRKSKAAGATVKYQQLSLRFFFWHLPCSKGEGKCCFANIFEHLGNIPSLLL